MFLFEGKKKLSILISVPSPKVSSPKKVTSMFIQYGRQKHSIQKKESPPQKCLQCSVIIKDKKNFPSPKRVIAQNWLESSFSQEKKLSIRHQSNRVITQKVTSMFSNGKKKLSIPKIVIAPKSDFIVGNKKTLHPKMFLRPKSDFNCQQYSQM